MRRNGLVIMLLGLLCTIACAAQAAARKPVVVFFVQQMPAEMLPQLPTGSFGLLQGYHSTADVLLTARTLRGQQIPVVFSKTLPPPARPIAFHASGTPQQAAAWIRRHHTTHAILLISYSNAPLNYLWFNSEKPAVLQSATTRRTGLITGSDVAELIAWHAGVRPASKLFRLDQPGGDPAGYIINRKHLLTLLFYARIIAIGVFLLAGVLFLTLKPGIKKRWFAYLLPLLPVFSLSSSLLITIIKPGVIPALLWTMLGSGTVAYLFAKREQPLGRVYAWLCLGSAMLFLTLTVTGIWVIYHSPISYNSLLNGGRFYGLNNDVQGMIFGAVFAGLFTLGAIYRLSATRIGLLLVAANVLLFIIFSPLFGVNVSGMFIATISSLAVMLTIPGKLRNRLLWSGATLAGFLLLGKLLLSWDMQQSTSTHLGSFANMVHANQLDGVRTIIVSKLRQVFWYSLIPPINLMIALQLYYLYRKPVLAKLPVPGTWQFARRILLVIVISELCLDDTGILTAAIMMAFFLVPFSYYALQATHDGDSERPQQRARGMVVN